jgi:hypothetical protein
LFCPEISANSAALESGVILFPGLRLVPGLLPTYSAMGEVTRKLASVSGGRSGSGGRWYGGCRRFRSLVLSHRKFSCTHVTNHIYSLDNYMAVYYHHLFTRSYSNLRTSSKRRGDGSFGQTGRGLIMVRGLSMAITT